jgi:hypothetical protein
MLCRVTSVCVLTRADVLREHDMQKRQTIPTSTINTIDVSGIAISFHDQRREFHPLYRKSRMPGRSEQDGLCRIRDEMPLTEPVSARIVDSHTLAGEPRIGFMATLGVEGIFDDFDFVAVRL